MLAFETVTVAIVDVGGKDWGVEIDPPCANTLVVVETDPD
jgi:hypothetical protein